MKKNDATLSSSPKKKVAVIGANGQVGTELCLFLKVMHDIEPVAISRSIHGNALLMRLGIECRNGTFNSIDEGKKLLEGCSGVIDLALPMGSSLPETKNLISQHLSTVFESMGNVKAFIYCSTMSVYRLDPTEPFFRWYGRSKQHGERESVRLGKKFRRQVYNIRLGQVHGEMQGCSLAILDQLYDGVVAQVPEIPSFSVFVFSIAEAVSNIVANKEYPGTYTLTSTPEWKYEELLLWYAKMKDINITINRKTVQTPTTLGATIDTVKDEAKRIVARLVYHYRDLVSTCIYAFSRNFEAQMRFRRGLARASQELKTYLTRGNLEPFNQRVIVRGKKMLSLSDSRLTMLPYALAVREMIRSLDPTVND